MSLNRLQQTVEDASLILRCESIRANSFQSYGVNSNATQLITQSTTITTTVDCGPTPSSTVLITTQVATAFAPGSSTPFIFRNNLLNNNSIVKVTLTDRFSGQNGINGIPRAGVLQFNELEVNECYIEVLNCGAQPISGAFNILVEIFNRI